MAENLRELLDRSFQQHAARPAVRVLGAEAEGRLAPVLPDWRLAPAAVYAVTPRRDEQPAKVRHALLALQQHFAARPG